MRDPRALLAQIKTGMVPHTWRVIRPDRAFLARRAAIYAVAGAAALAILGYCTFAGAVFGIGVSYDTPANVLVAWQIIDLVVLLGVIVLCAYRAIRDLAARDTVDEQFLILMPDGFVLRTDPDDKRTVVVGYRGVSSMTVEDLVGRVYLVMRTADAAGAKRVLIDGRFVRPSELARAIIADFTVAVGQTPPHHAGQLGQA